ncbi:MAG: GIY-YIG nuclease family protein [Patescibacteria group bacterium]
MYNVYILKCSDKSLYTGSTNNIEKRLNEHNNLKNGAKYTKARRPVFLVYKENCKTLGEARNREAEIKKMRRSEKIKLITDVI